MRLLGLPQGYRQNGQKEMNLRLLYKIVQEAQTMPLLELWVFADTANWYGLSSSTVMFLMVTLLDTRVQLR